MEFLGDAILGMLVADELVSTLPDATEGELTRIRSYLVREETLADIAREQKLGDLLILGPGELKSADWRRDSILADTVEAVLAAVYLDAGLEAARNALRNIYAGRWQTLPDAHSLKDAKTSLQEWTQGHEGWELPRYELLDESGPAHRRLFRVSGTVSGPDAAGRTIETSGRSRRRAEQDAASRLLDWLVTEFGA